MLADARGAIKAIVTGRRAYGREYVALSDSFLYLALLICSVTITAIVFADVPERVTWVVTFSTLILIVSGLILYRLGEITQQRNRENGVYEYLYKDRYRTH